MSDKWHKDHKKAIAEKWVQCPQIEARAEELRQKWATGQIGISALCKAHAHAENEIAELKADLAEAQAEVERLALEIENQQYTITCASEENQQLKESLSEARAEIDALRMGKRSPCDYYFSRESEENLYRDLAEVRADLRLAKNIIETHVERVAERDKLIEQMRDTLKTLKQRHYVNDDDNWYSCPASGLCSNDHAGTDCNCGADHVNSIIQAALRAADGGEG